MPYYNKSKKSKSKWVSYNNYYNNPYENAYAYHDIDMHHDEIAWEIEKNGLSNLRYVMTRYELKHHEINAPGFKHKSKVKIISVFGDDEKEIELTVNNSEDYVNEFAVAISPYLQYQLGYDFQYNTVRVENIS